VFKFNELKQIHLEITNRCQASCPMCNRNFHGGLPNPLIKNTDWTLEDFKNILTPNVLAQLDGFYFCGNFGDPIINSELAEMCEYAALENSNINIAIHTNGSARSVQWWEHLAKVLPKHHRVIFALDGLIDTHKLYRIGTDFDKILNNARAFINAGGIAEWCFIKFKHNEHQVHLAESLAKEYGFKTFTVKNSRRFIGEPKYPVYNETGKTTHYIEPPTDNKMSFINADIINNYKSIVEQSDIDCYVLKTKEIYIDFNKHVYPCCYLASVPYTYIDQDETQQVRLDINKQHNEYIAELGGIKQIDATLNTLENILAQDSWHTVWDKYWNTQKMITCARSCGKIKEISKPNDQIIASGSING
jgi:MoaA/NifB/PqqE/SkfB family radical SAM enzyme